MSPCLRNAKSPREAHASAWAERVKRGGFEGESLFKVADHSQKRGCMDSNAANARAPLGRAAALICIVALAATMGIFGAHLLPHDWRVQVRPASLQSTAELLGRSASGPASFADIVDAV